MSVTCNRTGCPNDGRWHPVLIVRPKTLPGRPPYRGEPARGMLELAVCDEHGRGVHVEDFVSDKNWAQITGGFKAGGYAEPDRSSVTLGWIAVGSPEAEVYLKQLRRARGQAS